MGLSIDEEHPSDDRTVLVLTGELGLDTVNSARERLLEVVSAGRYHLVLDLLGVTFIDSPGLGLLVGTAKRIRAHEGSLTLVCTDPEILKLFQVTGLTRVFPICSTREQALAAGV